ncbi:glycosyltransferase family 2 protein [Candidatus Kaiserbacteria bacterium]|nr:glycosyltransferase family 2 protein [Candidatus Kaiserbacteria bacterium]
MKLSFVIPAYNEQDYVGECIESIKREGKSNPYPIEIIVVNNASTDKTAAVARSYPEVKVIDEPHKGLVWARSAGFLASSGDLVANIDADSRLSTGWLKKVMDAFSSDPSLVALSGPFIHYDLESRTKRFLVWFWYVLVFVSQGMTKALFGTGAFLQGGNYVVRRRALQEIGGYDRRIEFYGEDSDIGRRIVKVGKVIFTFKLPVYSSARRIQREGMIVTAFRYTINYFWGLIFGKSFHNTYQDVRH